MAAVVSSEKTADLLHNLSLDPETKSETPDAAVTGSKGFYGGNGNGFLLPSEQVSMSADTTKGGKPSLLPNGGGVTANKGSNLKKLGYQNSSFNPKGSFAKGAYPAGFYSPMYQYPRYNYDGSFSSGKTNILQQYPYLNTHQARSTGMGQSYSYMDNMYSNPGMYGAYLNGLGAGYGYSTYGYDTWKQPNWYAVNNGYKTRGYGFQGYSKENIDGLNELNRGPRARGFKNQEGSQLTAIVPKEQSAAAGTEKPKEDVSVPDMKDYNKEDFPETYLHAKFYVIKSYSEDDVHKSIKYSVWSSTPNGNKKLDAAYNEAKEKSDACPVFLLFSVNTSGQFVGLAEMVGPVDFNKTVEYWQQDKWIGCFPVKWHIVKDIPNSSLRHITLENNENKPVTNSRDTQEVNLEHGAKIIKIFKDHSSKTCILDDFAFYEARQKIIQERKAKHQQFKKQALSTSDKVGQDKDEQEKTKETIPSLNPESEVTSESKGEDIEQAKATVPGNGVASSDVASAC
ncbi:PREDICTED: uncharacterized protein LOC104805762 isoform X1 [Tarenaya hassleriana]|uniref:uncharacterized protein LOC104805762 isoform X1 n=1 Tax=Tarenaya hassleriana TaxID=28532 RepID=UPI00053C8CC9|nr:PREDICTED: uncharacterized protein LOC104805762 isoform X1 [Tarenaya hassleriana]